MPLAAYLLFRKIDNINP